MLTLCLIRGISFIILRIIIMPMANTVYSPSHKAYFIFAPLPFDYCECVKLVVFCAYGVDAVVEI